MNNIIKGEKFENICDVEIVDLISNEDMELASECIADCLVGANFNGVVKYEPMNFALNIERDTSRKFFFDLLHDLKGEGISFLVKDLKTNKVVGAIVTEIYNPNIKIVKYSGIFEPYNYMYEFLDTLDFKFNDYIERTTGNKVGQDEYLHIHVICIKVKGRNIEIFQELMTKIEERANERLLKGIFAEATNPRSQIPLINKFSYINPIDQNGDPITLKYKDSQVFKDIPLEVATDCKLVYKKL